MENKILIETSARHVHLTEEHIEALFGKGEDAILAQETSAAQYFSSIAGAINNAITQRSPYSWK